MRLTIAALFGILAYFCLSVDAKTCAPKDRGNGCSLDAENKCRCYYGCKSDLPYKSLKSCKEALEERKSNPCGIKPCLRGICIQTVQAPGFACKCFGTGFYGNYCEKECPTGSPKFGHVFPYECVII